MIIVYTPIPYNLEIPTLFADKLIAPVIPANNPLTEEGVALGKKLFFDKVLSGDETQSCASDPEFTEPTRFSTGITGAIGTRNAMPLYNMAWNFEANFLWDGRAKSLEEQVSDPIENVIEMNNTWPNALATLQATNNYPELFSQAFGTSTITKELVTKAIAQFERTMVSGN